VNQAVDLFGEPVYTYGQRTEGDYYPTPVVCIDPLLELVDFFNVATFREPCRGVARSIYDRVPLPESRKQWAELSEGVEYLDTPMEPVDLIITNPPFNLGVEFAQKSLKEASTVCYLHRLSFMGSKGRKEFWRKNKPTHIFHIDRPSFTGVGTDNSDYAWYCWDRGGLIKAEPGMYWL
jgi:hypothetical protein